MRRLKNSEVKHEEAFYRNTFFFSNNALEHYNFPSKLLKKSENIFSKTQLSTLLNKIKF